MEITNRPRRLRSTPALRKMVRETRVDPSSLVYPMFVMDGKDRADEIKALPGQFRYTVDRVDAKVEEMLSAGVGSIMLFGIPEHKDEMGTQAYAEDGIIQRATAYIKEKYPEEYEARGRDLINYRIGGTAESFADLRDRVMPAFRRLVEETEGDIIIVSHSGVNRIIKCAVTGKPLDDVAKMKFGRGTYQIFDLGPDMSLDI